MNIRGIPPTPPLPPRKPNKEAEKIAGAANVQPPSNAPAEIVEQTSDAIKAVGSTKGASNQNLGDKKRDTPEKKKKRPKEDGLGDVIDIEV